MQKRNISPNNFEQCVKCAICTDFCPVLKVLPSYPGPKHGGPDGERLRLKNALFFDSNLKYCLNCKRCEVACPSGVRIADIIHSARDRYGEDRPSLRDWMLANTDTMGTLASPFAPVVNGALGLGVTKSVLDGVMKIDHRRTFPKYAGRKFTTWFRREAEAAQAGYKKQVSYFHGCYVNYNYPQLGKDFVRVMNALGYGVRLLDKEKCCGVAMMSGGMFDAARRNAAVNLASVGAAASEGRLTLTTSSTCTLTMREEYPGVLGIDNEAVRDDIVLAVRFIFEAVERGEVQLAFKEGFRARAAYHVPCHMEKLGWSLFTRALMERIPGMELVPLESICCGIAGTYGFKKENYERSQRIGQPLFDNIAQVRPDFVVCECETCKWQIEMSTGVEVRNPISVLAEALDLEATAALNHQ
ncbi:MAG: anaerobic glycerol-3-phosphate dehydrogenase subunit C [Bacteroidales bacterium]|nr:anaerobic glycerol-3-phosphate dehydrogenase subunit C [Bacteroidales bacterium]